MCRLCKGVVLQQSKKRAHELPGTTAESSDPAKMKTLSLYMFDVASMSPELAYLFVCVTSWLTTMLPGFFMQAFVAVILLPWAQ